MTSAQPKFGLWIALALVLALRLAWELWREMAR